MIDGRCHVTDELLNDVDTGIIVIALFIALIAALEIGSRLGQTVWAEIGVTNLSDARWGPARQTAEAAA
jgi:hypothetical protein